jgi:hypothetical protein
MGELIDWMGGHKWGKDMQKNAHQMLTDLDAINADINKRTKNNLLADIFGDDIFGDDIFGDDGTESEINAYQQSILDERYRIIVDAHKKQSDEDKKFQDDYEKAQKDIKDAIEQIEKDKINGIIERTELMIQAMRNRENRIAEISKSIIALNSKKPEETTQSTNIRQVAEDLDNVKETLGNIYSQGATQAVTGMAEWVGAFAVGAKSFQDLGKLMGSIFGDIMMQVGKHMVATSTAIKAFKASLAGLGVGGIVIGLGLIAVGSALKAGSQSSGSSYQQVPINSVSNYQPVYTPYNSQGNSGAGGRVSVQITQAPNILRGGDIRTSQQTVDYGISRGFGTQQGF